MSILIFYGIDQLIDLKLLILINIITLALY